MKIEYIDNDKSKGINYNYNFIVKEYKKLVNKTYWSNIDIIPFSQAKYFIEISERSIGKTTKWLLFGMLMNKYYGTHIQYIRQVLDMIMPKNMKIFRTILEYDYVEKITDGKYNSVKYQSRSFFYYNTETDEIATEPFMDCLSIDNNDKYVSSYNAPTGDLIIFDEFINRKYYHINEFCDFEDLVKTIIRDRESPIVVMISNTIDRYNEYFKELEIYDIIQSMPIGNSRLITTDMGTHIYISLLTGNYKGDKAIQKTKHNNLFFGFKNEKLNSIRGGNWATNSFPHIPRYNDTAECIINNRYIYINGQYLRIEIYNSLEYGTIAHIHLSNKPKYNDSIIYTTEYITSNNERFGFGNTKTDKYIWSLYSANRFYYSDNMIGELCKAYIRLVKTFNKN